jgi:hypothetical protein
MDEYGIELGSTCSTPCGVNSRLRIPIDMGVCGVRST